MLSAKVPSSRTSVLFSCLLIFFLSALCPSIGEAQGVGRKDRKDPFQKSPALKAAVRKAIRKGVTWLKAQQTENGSFKARYRGNYPLGSTGLPCLALAVCGESTEGEALTNGFQFLRSRYYLNRRDGTVVGKKVYGVSLAVMAMIEAHRPPVNSLLAKDRKKRRQPEVQLSSEDQDWMINMTDWLIGKSTEGRWSYPGGPDQFDHSNTQFAVLALHSAHRAGIKVPRSLFLKTLRHFVGRQEQEGPEVKRFIRSLSGVLRTGDLDKARGFGYTGPNRATGSMTAAGVACLAACRNDLMRQRTREYSRSDDKKAKKSIQDGLAWLAHHFTVESVPDPDFSVPERNFDLFHFYYLYTLERACGLTETELLGAWNWYLEGAIHLLELQSDEGFWSRTNTMGDEAGHSLINTCFALLFLSRLSDPGGRMMTERPDRNLVLSGGKKLKKAEFDALFDTAFSLFHRSGPAGISADEFRKLGERVYPRLLANLSSSDDVTRQASYELLVHLSGESFEFQFDGPEENRRDAIMVWARWWQKRELQNNR